MKNLIFLILFLLMLNKTSYAQNPYLYGLFGYGSASSSIMLGEAAMYNAQGNVLLDQSQANINNEIAYSMRMNNNIMRVQTYFQMRQINRYYRDLEEWQKEERTMLKRYGLYNREAIESLYQGVRK